MSSRKLSYMRSVSRATSEAIDLETIIQTLMNGKNLPIKVIFGDKVIEALPIPDLGDFGGVALHLISYQEQAHEILIDHNKDELSTLPPPEKSDFVKARLFAIITDCHVVALPIHPARNGLAIHFARGLDPTQLSVEQAQDLAVARLTKPPTKDALDQIEQVGVKEIKLDWSIPASHINEKLKQKGQTIPGLIQSIFSGEDLAAEDDQAEGELVFEGRLKPKSRRGDVRVRELDEEKRVARAVLDNDEGYGYKITLTNDKTITPEEMETSRIETFDEGQPGMIDPKEAFARLLGYHAYLKDQGAFD